MVAASVMSFSVMPPDGAMHERQLDPLALELAQALGDGLERTLDVGLEDDVERGGLARLDLLEDVLEPDSGLDAGVAALRLDPLVVLAGLGDRACDLLVGSGPELVAGARHARQAEHLHRRRRARSLQLLAGLVDHRPHPTPRRPGDDRVTDVQLALVDEHGGDRAATGVEVGLEHDTLGTTGRVRRQLLELGDDEQLVE